MPSVISPEYIALPAASHASKQLVFQVDQLLISSPGIFNFMSKKSLWRKTRLLTNSCTSFPSAEEIVTYHPWLIRNACMCLSDSNDSTLTFQLLHMPLGTRPSQKWPLKIFLLLVIHVDSYLRPLLTQTIENLTLFEVLKRLVSLKNILYTRENSSTSQFKRDWQSVSAVGGDQVWFASPRGWTLARFSPWPHCPCS